MSTQQINIPYSKVKSIDYDIMSRSEIADYSLCIVNEQKKYLSSDEQGSVSSLLMGAVNQSDVCKTCELKADKCPGHMGHIQLSMDIYNIFFIREITLFLSLLCYKCHGFLLQIKNKRGDKFPKIINFLNELKYIPKLSDRLNIAVKIAVNLVECPFCEYKNPKYFIKNDGNTRICVEPKKNIKKQIISDIDPEFTTKKKGSFANIILPSVAYYILSDFKGSDLKKLGYDPTRFHPSYLILSTIPVIPNCVRPDNFNGGQKYEDDTVRSYKRILNASKKVDQHGEKTDKPKEYEVFINNHDSLTNAVGSLYGFVKKSDGKGFKTGKKSSVKSLADRFKGKKEHIRGNILSKRVECGARTVISPDVKIPIDCIGLPMKIALKMAIQVVVTPGNINECMTWLRNGPNVYPGAISFILTSTDPNLPIGGLNKKIHLISAIKPENLLNTQLRYGDIIERHPIDGDIVEANRQPSLHKYSFNGLTVKVLPGTKKEDNTTETDNKNDNDNDGGDTIRLNPCDCKPFNADFDGDEMNIFFFNSQAAYAEIDVINKITNSIITERDSTVLISVIQDNIIGFYHLAKTSRKFTRHEAMKIINECDLVDPIIPQLKTFTGKDIISAILPKFTVENSKFKIIDGKLISGDFASSTIKLLIQELLSRYNREIVKTFIFNIVQITNIFNRIVGVSACYSDVMCSESQSIEIKQMIDVANIKIQGLVSDIQNDKMIVPIGMTTKERYEELILNNIIPSSLDLLLTVAKKTKTETSSFVQMSLASDSKAKTINLQQMIGCLGQQMADGGRIKYGLRHRTMIFYPKYAENLESRGLVANSFYSGLNYAEYVTHGNGGRDNLIDTALITATVGYTTRRLWSSESNIQVAYDGTVRDNGLIIQQNYGGDGFLISKTSPYQYETLNMTSDELKKLVL